jgi:hypothetical protein
VTPISHYSCAHSVLVTHFLCSSQDIPEALASKLLHRETIIPGAFSYFLLVSAQMSPPQRGPPWLCFLKYHPDLYVNPYLDFCGIYKSCMLHAYICLHDNRDFVYCIIQSLCYAWPLGVVQWILVNRWIMNARGLFSGLGKMRKCGSWGDTRFRTASECYTSNL